MSLTRRSVLFCAIAAAALPAVAQTAGGISGQIVDGTTQAQVPGATIVASGPALQGEQAATSDEHGAFALTALPPGVYALNVQRDGYQAFTREGLTVRLDRTIVVRLSILPDAAGAAPFELGAPRPALSLPGALTGGTVSREQMDLLPYGRDVRGFEQAALAVPGVATDRFGLQLPGSQSLESRIVVDGADVTDPASNRQGTRLLQNFVEEIAVDTGGYGAQWGRAAGGRVHVVTRSGSNEFHGSAFLDVTPLEASRKDAPAFGAAVVGKESLRYDVDGGFELGGPLLRDRLWFYAGFAPQIVSRNVDRVIQAGATAVSSRTYTATATEFQYVGKLDFRAADDHSLALSVFGNPGTASGVMAPVAGNESAFVGRGTSGSDDVALRYLGKLLDRRLQVDAGVFWHRSGFSVSPSSVGAVSAQQLADAPQVTWSQTLNLLDPRLTDATTPMYQTGSAVIAACTPTAANPLPCPVSGYATGGLTPQDASAHRAGARLELSTFADGFGRHRLAWGADVARDSAASVRTFSGGMQAQALPGGQLAITAFARRDPLNPSAPARDAQGSLLGTAAETSAHQWTLAAFVQDSWNLAERLWLDAGIRVERQRSFASGGAQGLQLTGVMPRVGLSYDFTGRGLSKAYAFFGRFYESVPLDAAVSVLSAPTTVRYAARSCGASTSAGSLDPRKCAALSPYAFSSSPALDASLRGGFDDQYSAGAQYQLLRDVVAGIDYTHRTLGRAVEDVAGVVTNPAEASRTYDGVTLALAKQFSQGYLLQASYTLSSWRGTYTGPSELDVASLANRSGALPGDMPQVFKLDGAYAYEYSPKITFTFGGVFRAFQGAPVSFLARDPAAPQAGETASFVLPRGSAGRLPWQTTLDLRGGFTYALTASYAATVTLDLLNLFNRQTATAEDERYSLDPSGVAPQPPGTPLASIRNGAGQPVTVNPGFRSALAYTPPLAARLGLKLSF